MTSDDRLRHCARCGWRPEYGRHDGRTTCPGFVSVQNVPADPPVPFTEDELGSVWFAAALLESERADERAARAMQAVVLAAADLVEPLAFPSGDRKADARLRAGQRARLRDAVRAWRALDAAEDAARAAFIAVPTSHERAAARRAPAPTTEASAS